MGGGLSLSCCLLGLGAWYVPARRELELELRNASAVERGLVAAGKWKLLMQNILSDYALSWSMDCC
jgi:hypothetical protein